MKAPERTREPGMPTLEAARPNPMDGLYAFVRDHLAIVNAIVVASATLVGVLDFLARACRWPP